MRIIAFILVLLVSAQIAMPCCNGMDHCDGSEIPVSDTQETPKENHDCGGDCTGLCCGITFTIQQLDMSVTHVALQQVAYSFDYQFDYQFDLASSVWHPPTLC